MLDVPPPRTFAATAHAIGETGGAAIYVGYSMGGRLCLRLAIDRPDLVRALVLVSASPGIVDPTEREARVEADEILAACLRRLGAGAMEPMWGEVPQLRMPVLIVTGTRDEKYTAIGRRMLERMGLNVSLVQLDGGHALPLEQPGVLGGLITAFATEHGVN